MLWTGLLEIAQEFGDQKSERAKNYMTWFSDQISEQTAPKQRAMTAAKLVELSILLHPKNAELGFPIDVLQLNKTTGVQWIQKKQNCPSN
jgi:hypothetical protein